MSEAYYLVKEREADIVASVLVDLDHDDSAMRSAADRILSGLIETGLVDLDAGPFAFQAWADAEDALTFSQIHDAYMGIEDDDDEEDEDEG